MSLETDITGGVYKQLAGASTAESIAHVLDWAASKYPGDWVPIRHLVAAALGCKLPRANDPLVELIRNRLGSAAKVLRTMYHRCKVNQLGMVRATVDDEDIVRAAVTEKARRAETAYKSLIATHQMVDLKNVTDPQLRKYHARVGKTVNPKDMSVLFARWRLV